MKLVNELPRKQRWFEKESRERKDKIEDEARPNRYRTDMKSKIEGTSEKSSSKKTELTSSS